MECLKTDKNCISLPGDNGNSKAHKGRFTTLGHIKVRPCTMTVNQINVI